MINIQFYDINTIIEVNDILYMDEKLLKEKESLEKSIERREKLLSNENYVSKAPSSIVEKEREDLKKEKKLLNSLLNKFTK